MYIWAHIGMYMNVNMSVDICVLLYECIQMYNVWRASDESVMLIWEVKKRKK